MADILNYSPSVKVFPSKSDSPRCEFLDNDDERCQHHSTAVLISYTFDIYTDAAKEQLEYACPDHIQALYSYAEQVFEEYQQKVYAEQVFEEYQLKVYDELQELKQQFL